MMKYLKYLLVSFFALGVAVLALNLYLSLRDKGDILYPKNALAVFADKNLTEETLYALKPFNYYPVFAANKIIMDTKGISDQTMIRRYTVSNEIELYGKRYWCSENIILKMVQDKNGGKIFVKDLFFEANPSFLPFILFGLSIAFILIYKYLKTSSVIYSYLFYLILWYTGILLLFYVHGFFFIYNYDSNQWFEMAREWLDGNRVSRLNNTFGTSYLYALFISLLDGKTFIDIAVPVSLSNMILVGGGTLMMTLHISYRLFKSMRILHATGIVAIIFSLTAWIFHKGLLEQPNHIGKTMLYFGNLHPFSLSFWYQSLLLCWNGMSDNIGLFFAMVGFSTMICMKRSGYKYLVSGFVLGIGLCIRYTSVLLWPAIFLLDIYSNLKEGKNYFEMFRNYSILATFAIIAFLPQLIDNYLVVGSMFHPALPAGQYVNGEEKLINLFNISSLDGFHYFGQVNFKILSLGIFSLYFISDRIMGLSLWLWLIIPLSFHSLLKIHDISPVRYIIMIFPCVYVLAGYLFGSLDRKSILAFVPILILNFMLAAPENPGTYAPIYLDYKWHYIIPLASIILAWALTKSIGISKDKTVCFTAFMIVFMAGQWWILLLALAVYPLYLLLKPSLLHSSQGYIK